MDDLNIVHGPPDREPLPHEHDDRIFALKRWLHRRRRNNPTGCVAQLPGCTGQAEQRHHMRPRSDGGGRGDNLMWVCHPCHRLIHQVEPFLRLAAADRIAQLEAACDRAAIEIVRLHARLTDTHDT